MSSRYIRIAHFRKPIGKVVCATHVRGQSHTPTHASILFQPWQDNGVFTLSQIITVHESVVCLSELFDQEHQDYELYLGSYPVFLN